MNCELVAQQGTLQVVRDDTVFRLAEPKHRHHEVRMSTSYRPRPGVSTDRAGARRT